MTLKSYYGRDNFMPDAVSWSSNFGRFDAGGKVIEEDIRTTRAMLMSDTNRMFI
jgi:hypothetical protein